LACRDHDHIAIIDNAEQAATLLQPLRIRLVELLREPDTAAGVARKLGLPRQLVNYHMRQLETSRLLELVEERRLGARTERVLKSAARSYLVGPGALGPLAADRAQLTDRMSASHVLAMAARMIRRVSAALSRAAADGKRVAALSVLSEVRFRSAHDRNAFAEELTSALAELIAKYHDDSASDARRFELALGVYPAVNPPDGETMPDDSPTTVEEQS
jgi:DNA-binding transcriptional ArsR family regulator